MNVFFTSDLHFGHRKVAEIRGFESVEEHDDAICERWVEQVRRGDQVWVLGDLSIGQAGAWAALDIIAALPGEKHLVWGNHDLGHPMHRDAHRKAGRYFNGFSTMQAFARRRFAGKEVLLSHFPYEGDTPGRGEDRHVAYRLRDEGVPLIHGHTHGPERRTRTSQGTVQVHVGWDAWGHLVPGYLVEGAVWT